MFEDSILSEISKRIIDDKKAVTYPWLQHTFNFSPTKAEKCLNQFVSEITEANAEYLKTVVDDIESFTMISLKPTSDKVDLTHYETSDNTRKHMIVCNEAKCVPRPIKSTSLVVKPKIELPKKSDIKCPSKVSSTVVASSVKKDNPFLSFKPIEVKDELKVNNNTIKEEIVPKQVTKKITNSKTIKQSTIKPEVKESELKETSKKRNNFYDNFENESPEKSKTKRRRLVIESDNDDSSDDDVILVNDSMIEETPLEIIPKEVQIKSKVSATVDVSQRKILKQVERTFIDDEGFLVSQKVLEDVSHNELITETKKKSPVIKVAADTTISKKGIKKTVVCSKDSKKSTQTNLMNYFQKKT